jgi:hypothetical protein
MLFVIDRDNNLAVYESVRDAESDLETIDVEDCEYEFRDETGQRYIGEILKPVGKFSSGEFRIVSQDTRDPSLPAAFISRALDDRSRVLGLKTLDEARARFGHK